jgi:aminoglycoside/choline kinase family phosphotransferase
VIGVHNEDPRENKAFIAFTYHFLDQGLPVPQILASDPEHCIYLLSDLGDTTLFQFLTENRAEKPEDPGDSFPPKVLEIYKKAIEWLPQFQVKAGKTLDYSVCYPRAAFDRQSMLWDLNYFKYYFLKLAKIPFDEQALEDDFSALCDILLQADSSFFLFRDFQSRNIMVMNGEPWFIDYQGGRRGALQYDIASLLIDGKADIPENVRKGLLGYYLDVLSDIHPVDRKKFLYTYDAFVLIRILQALGAYGFRGYYEGKAHFLKSIPYALRNLGYLRANGLIGSGMPELMQVLDRMIASPLFPFEEPVRNMAVPLVVSIFSFSYKKSIPDDPNGNGGGFVFDCRALPNPGRREEFKALTGKDQAVIDFLKDDPSVKEFLRNAFSLVDQSISNYQFRGFKNLMVSFGCTGGQHRSVYCAEQLTKHLQANLTISTTLTHTEQSPN